MQRMTAELERREHELKERITLATEAQALATAAVEAKKQAEEARQQLANERDLAVQQAQQAAAEAEAARAGHGPAAPPMGYHPAPRRQELKPEKPPKFNGNGTDPKPDVKTWCFMIDNWLETASVEEHLKVGLASSLLEGRAAIWWYHRKSATEFTDDTYDSFKEAIKRNFRRPNEDQHARDRLAKIRQNGSAASYASDMRSLLTELGPEEVTDKEAYDRFYRGLKPHLALELNKAYELNLRRKPTLEEAIEYVVRIEGAMTVNSGNAFSGNKFKKYNQRQFYGGYGNGGGGNGGASSGNSRGGGQGDGPVPMELGAISTNGTNVGPPYWGLDQTQRGDFIKDHRCFKCHRVGHRSNNCQNPPASRASSKGSGNGRSR